MTEICNSDVLFIVSYVVATIIWSIKHHAEVMAERKEADRHRLRASAHRLSVADLEREVAARDSKIDDLIEIIEKRAEDPDLPY